MTKKNRKKSPLMLESLLISLPPKFFSPSPHEKTISHMQLKPDDEILHKKGMERNIALLQCIAKAMQ